MYLCFFLIGKCILITFRQWTSFYIYRPEHELDFRAQGFENYISNKNKILHEKKPSGNESRKSVFFQSV